MRASYSETELNEIKARVEPRHGWDFSRMSDWRAPVPWSYEDVVGERLAPRHDVLDIGTGGGEILRSFANRIHTGLGIDIDQQMVQVARENADNPPNVGFRRSSHLLEDVQEVFDVVLSRHAPFSVDAFASHLKDGGVFITQQVGERNMANVKAALGQSVPAPVTRETFDDSALTLLEFREYDVTYIVPDIDSLVFWLRALDTLHADIDGARAIGDASSLNAILQNNVSADGFVTNEHRYLAIAEKSRALAAC
ncbi:class I SAM-dependent methyltransferase [Frondihabitans peucedani]|uniref:Class I SAM-dependent methyltransferase n=1 Tax=Frondihabitans peucedani TaxID=598626 RepID=A0ABP8E6Q7_9MICO